MVYSDINNLNGIIQEEERLTGLGYALISGVTEKLKEFTSLNNIANNQIWHLIHEATGNWQYDDSNKTDLPSATTNIVSGTATYVIPDDALTINRIEIKDSAGTWFKLKPVTLEEIPTEGEFMTDSGVPRYYRAVDNVVTFYPSPNYDSTNGLKVFYDRGCVDFTTSDTTTKAGFASPYHSLLPIKASLMWLKASNPTSPKIPMLLQDEAKLEKALVEFYGKRFKDKKPRVGRIYSSFK